MVSQVPTNKLSFNTCALAAVTKMKIKNPKNMLGNGAGEFVFN